MKEEDVVKIITGWKDEIKGLVSDYEQAIVKLDNARKKYETSKWERFIKIFPFLLPILYILTIALMLQFCDKLYTIKAAGVEASRNGPSADTTRE